MRYLTYEPCSRGDRAMIRRVKTPPAALLRPRVTPDPQHAAELERRMNALEYYPENGFHRDRSQERLRPRPLRLLP
jgi:hypothetical protein